MRREREHVGYLKRHLKVAKIYWPVFLLVNMIAFNEYFIYYSTLISQCNWPCGEAGCGENALKTFMIADTHLLGQRRGHFFDKFRREWQMYMSYRAAVGMFDPDAVFFLGDLTDEGQWADEELFKVYTDRFDELFGSTGRPKVVAVAGNHDLGFHYAMSPDRNDWFSKEFNRTAVDLLTLKGTPFVLLNSMAFEGDNCRFCAMAEQRVYQLGKILEKDGKRPIVLQHYPLFRTSDAECLEEEPEAKREKYRERWEVISRDATNLLIEQLRPRAAFGGHSHKSCRKIWRKPVEFVEYTINSFSWRNNDRPSFLMTVVENDELKVSICHLPRESTQIMLYVHAISVVIFGFMWRAFKKPIFKFLYNMGILSRQRVD